MKLQLVSHSENKSEIFTLSFEELKSYLSSLKNEKHVFFVVDKTLAEFSEYKNLFEKSPFFLFDASEDNKTLNTVEKIYDFLLQNNADRSSFLIAIGGGITLDIAGFAASTYMRGMNFGFVPTTLLSMVDASIGGKNGVNFRNYKNYIGNFNHPRFIAICDYFLSTLPEKELSVGLAEVIKYGVVCNSEIFSFLENVDPGKLKRGGEEIAFIIEKSVKAKVDVVEKDFKESGLRKILNFGHTLGHALERLKKVNHGEGVAAGMVFAGFLAKQKGIFSEDDFLKLEHIIKKFGLPVFVEFESVDEVINGITGDKKKTGDLIDFVFPVEFGKPLVERISFEEIRKGLYDLRKYYGK